MEEGDDEEESDGEDFNGGLQVEDEGEEEEVDTSTPAYPRPTLPETTMPPQELLHKIEQTNIYLKGNSGLSPLSVRFGMFQEPVYALRGLPSSLVFRGGQPTAEAIEAIRLVHRHFLGEARFGLKEGCYGAGGGGIHVIYLDGRHLEDRPQIEDLVALTHPSQAYRSSHMKWMTTYDPLHQHMFPKKRAEYLRDWHGDDDYGSVLPLDDVSRALLLSDALDTVPFGTPPNYILRNYPSLEHGKCLFLLPRFSYIHDGECLHRTDGNQADNSSSNDSDHSELLCPMAMAFERQQNLPNALYWSDFQNIHRPDETICQETAGGTAMEAGDVNEAPTFAMFRLRSTKEILALVQWDYRD